MRERNVYRGRVLELSSRHFHDDEDAPLTVRTLPQIARDRIVLPPGVLERIERQAFGIADHAERLRASGRHLRRGLLLHGPPGTGKTLTAMYLAAQMPGRTAVLLTGQSLGAVGASIDLATALQPAMVVLEDVDLVAMDRAFEPTNAILFELLNGMDGLDEDHDVLFVLTTNRADLLEPALAARPGRIDQAVELPLPDADGRRRLLELYGEGLQLTLTGDEPLIAALEGVSPAFIRELLRRAALMAAEESEGALSVGAGPGARAGGAPPRRRRPHERVARRAAVRARRVSEVFRRLLPGPLEEGFTAADLAAAVPGEPPAARPFLLLNMIATADGRATIGGRTAPLANRADYELFHALRERADAVMVGAGTVRVEGYGPMDQLAVVVSRSVELPVDRGLLPRRATAW